MSWKEKIEGLLRKAKELEKKYEWLEAVTIYEQVLRIAERGEFLERIGFCFHRAAMQAKTQKEFRDRMHQAIKVYRNAHRIYEKLADKQKVARMFRCEATINYLKYWLTSDPSEKRKLLDKCLESEGKALTAFSRAGDMLEYGRTYTRFKLVFQRRITLEWNRQVRERLADKGIEWGKIAIAALSKSGKLDEIAEAYFTLGVCYREYIPREAGEEQAGRYLSKAIDLFEEVGDEYLLGLSHLYLGMNTSGEESVKHWRKALECGKRTGDHFLIGRSLDLLAYITYWKAYATEDFLQRNELACKAMQLYDEAQNHFSVISYISPRAGLVGWPTAYADHYFYLAKWETDPNKRRVLLKKSEKACLEALKLAEASDMPSTLCGAFITISNIFETQARLEHDYIEKKKLLMKAMEYREKTTEILDQLFSFDNWNRGVTYNAFARIKAELARIESDYDTKISLLKEAILTKEKSVKLCYKWIKDQKTSVRFASLYHIQDDYAALLMYAYNLTANSEYLRKAIDISRKAIDLASRLGMVSRIAESYWKIAKALDTLGDFIKAAKNFEHASESYMLAAEKMPQLKDFYLEYVSYMKAWAEVEKARYKHEMEDHKQASKHYQTCSHYLEKTKKWTYLSSYFFAWSLLERGEELSRLDRPQDAMEAFEEAGRIFEDSIINLRKKLGELESSEERDEAYKLIKIAGLRKQYCIGRLLMEQAKLSDRNGDKILSAEKYSEAARIFEGITPKLMRKEARGELQFAAFLCRAWEKMELAEEKEDFTLYEEAAELFAKASEFSCRKTARWVAVGNSCFCEALGMGMRLMITSNMDFYSGAKLQMENAANCYRKAGFDKLALWVEATKKLVDAYVYACKAEAETEPERRVRFYLMAEKCLELSAELYGKAGYPNKKNETIENLKRVRKERELALSLNKILTVPTVLSSVTEISMPNSTEKPAGLNNFESVNIKARLSVPKEFISGEEFQIKLDLANVGKKACLLVRVEGFVPRKCKVLKVSSNCVLEDDSLNMKGKKLDSLSIESISVWVQVKGTVGISLSPRVIYIDEFGEFRTIEVKRAKILPVVEFESKESQVIFEYLVAAFMKDSVRRRLNIERSGWRSLPQIIKETGVSKRSLYGSGGRLGYGLSELQRKGLIDLRAFRGERGRGGHILKVRVHHKKELVRRYVKEKRLNISK